MDEEAALLPQLARVRAGIQSLQNKLLEALERNFESEDSTAWIHREAEYFT